MLKTDGFTNRRQVFAYFVRRWDRMLTISLWQLLFSVAFVALLYVSSVAEAGLTGNYTGAEYAARVIQLRTTTSLLSFVAFYPMMLGFSGAFYLTRKMVWLEGSSLTTDFFKGVKSSFVNSIFPSIVCGVAYMFTTMADLFVQAYFGSNIFAYLVVALIVTFLLSIAMFDLAQNSIYITTFSQRFKNSFILAAVRFPQCFLVIVASVLPFVFVLYLPVLGLVIAFTVMGLYWFAGAVLLQTLFCHHVFDKFINAADYPQLVNKGLTKGE